MPSTRDGDFVICLTQDQAGAHVHASIQPTEGEGPYIASGWKITPEAALVALCEQAREKRISLGATSAKSVREDGEEGLYIWLARVFG